MIRFRLFPFRSPLLREYDRYLLAMNSQFSFFQFSLRKREKEKRSFKRNSNRYFLFLWLLRCFNSPGYLHPNLAARRSSPMKAKGFPHSDISGSKVAQHLPEAYRSRPRPSSPSIAKASTVYPYRCMEHLHQCEARLRAGTWLAMLYR